MATGYDPTNNGGDPCAVFFNGFASDIKPPDVSTYFHERGYNNRIMYQRLQPQQFRLYLALKFENSETAKEVCEKFNKKIIFGYKILLSFFKKSFLRRNNSSYPFMQDRIRKMRAQAARRPFFFKKRFYSHLSPARNFRSRSRRRSRSSSSNSDRSISPKRKRRTRSREKVSSNRRDRSHSRSRSSRSSRSSSRSRTPNRFSLSPSSSKRSNSSVDRFSDKTSYSNKRKVQSKVSVVDSKKYSNKRSRSTSETQEENSPTKGKQVSASPHKERFLSNFSPVSCTSDDDVMLASTSPGPAVCLRTMTTAKHATVSIHPELKVQTDVSNHTANSFSATPSSHSKREDWGASEGDSTPLEGTPSPRGPGLGPLSQLSPKQSYGVYGKVGTFKEIKTMDRPWQLKPLTIRDEGSTNTPNQVEMQSFTISVTNTNAPFDGGNNAQAGNRIVVQSNRTESPYSVTTSGGAAANGQPTLTSPTRPQSHPSSHDGGWSPGVGQRIQSPTASSTIKVNGLKKPGQPDFNQEKLEKLKAKKEEIIKAYKQDCDTFATVVRMLIRKDAGLEQRLQQALRENLTEIGQRCVQELQDVVDQMKD